MSTMFSGAFSKDLVPGYMRVLFNAYKERPIEGTKLVNLKPSTRAYEEDFETAGSGTLRTKPQGAAINFEGVVDGTTKRYLWTTYALGYRITRELLKDQLYGVFGNKMAAALGRSARNNKEVVMHSPLNNAFSTSYVGWEAGVALCSVSHTILKTGASRDE